MINHRNQGCAVRGIVVTTLWLLLLAVPKAEAAPITLTWDFNIQGTSSGPFDGTRVIGELSYDYDPLRDLTITTYNPDGSIATIQYPQVPVSYFVLNFGGLVFGLADAVTPPVFSPVFSNVYGLSYVLRQGALPGQTNFAISPGAALFYSLSGPSLPFGTHIGQEAFAVPEAPTIILMSGAMVGVCLMWRRRRAALAPAVDRRADQDFGSVG